MLIHLKLQTIITWHMTDCFSNSQIHVIFEFNRHSEVDRTVNIHLTSFCM